MYGRMAVIPLIGFHAPSYRNAKSLSSTFVSRVWQLATRRGQTKSRNYKFPLSSLSFSHFVPLKRIALFIDTLTTLVHRYKDVQHNNSDSS
uniref:Uncharacterized protein n=1 Tax=Pararge aegeria TaxID=116150 RepID=S4P1Z2_9NEOP